MTRLLVVAGLLAGLAATPTLAQSNVEQVPEARGCLDLIGNQITNICTRTVRVFYCYERPTTTPYTCPHITGSVNSQDWGELVRPGGFLDVPVPGGTGTIQYEAYSCETQATNMVTDLNNLRLRGCARRR